MSMIFVGRRLTPGQVSDLEADPSLAVELLDEGDTPLDLELDKAWHGIHFLLAGSAWGTTPGAGEAVLGGEPIGEDDGYGPPRLLRPERVRAVASELSALGFESLRTRFDPAVLTNAEIYPGIWYEESIFETYVMPSFVALREFYVDAARENHAMLLTLA